jgi:hypothetical protein
VCAGVLPNADPLHKVTILPIGMALGVTQQLPRGPPQLPTSDYIEDSLVVMLGGRIAEELVFGVVSTGANNDLVGHRAGPQDGARVGHVRTHRPHGLGLAGQVFLGEDLMHTRDYSDETARVIDEEVERILREGQPGAGGSPQRRVSASRNGRLGPRRHGPSGSTGRTRDPAQVRPGQAGFRRPGSGRAVWSRARGSPPAPPHRSVAVEGPTKLASTTPSASAITVIGTASMR